MRSRRHPSPSRDSSEARHCVHLVRGSVRPERLESTPGREGGGCLGKVVKKCSTNPKADVGTLDPAAALTCSG